VSIRVTVATVIFTIRDRALHVLLVKRGVPPFQDEWAIPGGFTKENESLDESALRELREETGVKDVYLEQLYSFGDLRRDPRGRVVTVAYFALISQDRATLEPGTDAVEAQWYPMNDLPQLAFDHGDILSYALVRLRNKLEYTTVGFQLLPSRFTLPELQLVYEAILGRNLDKRNFRRKIESLGILRPLNAWSKESQRRPARLYNFAAAKFEKLKDKGILFPF